MPWNQDSLGYLGRKGNRIRQCVKDAERKSERMLEKKKKKLTLSPACLEDLSDQVSLHSATQDSCLVQDPAHISTPAYAQGSDSKI